MKSSNRGNYMELMQFLADHNEKVRKVVLENAPKNLKYTSSDIQKDLVHACAIETINAITKDMEGTFFFSLSWLMDHVTLPLKSKWRWYCVM